MKNIFIITLCLLSLLLLPINAQANGIAKTMSELKESVQTVREKLVVLLVVTDKDKQMQYIDEIKFLSQAIDDRLSTLQKSHISKELAERLMEFKSVWTAFRITRDTEIIPNLLSGDTDKINEAKTIARTIQAERFQKMQALLQ